MPRCIYNLGDALLAYITKTQIISSLPRVLSTLRYKRQSHRYPRSALRRNYVGGADDLQLAFVPQNDGRLRSRERRCRKSEGIFKIWIYYRNTFILCASFSCYFCFTSVHALLLAYALLRSMRDNGSRFSCMADTAPHYSL